MKRMQSWQKWLGLVAIHLMANNTVAAQQRVEYQCSFRTWQSSPPRFEEVLFAEGELELERVAGAGNYDGAVRRFGKLTDSLGNVPLTSNSRDATLQFALAGQIVRQRAQRWGLCYATARLWREEAFTDGGQSGHRSYTVSQAEVNSESFDPLLRKQTCSTFSLRAGDPIRVQGTVGTYPPPLYPAPVHALSYTCSLELVAATGG